MEITTELLSRFVGGQLEIQNQKEGYPYRGEVESVEVDVDEDLIKVRFAWLANGEGYPPIPTRWVKDDRLDYSVSLMLSSASDNSNGRLTVNVYGVGEFLVFFPPDGSKLDPARVEGLVLAS